jgi:ATP-dependent protease ClpP protease subunit
MTKNFWLNKHKYNNNNVPKEFGPTMDDMSDVDPDSVKMKNNKIHFYSEVDRSSILTLNKSLIEVDESIVYNTKIWKCPELCPILLHINSNGGNIFAALSAVDYIRNTEAPVHTIIDGCAASAATLMSVAGKRRFINRNAFMLIHQLSAWQGGTYEQLKDEQKNNDMLMKVIMAIYQKYSKIPQKKLDEILKRDLWFDAKTCLRYGLVDEILP